MDMNDHTRKGLGLIAVGLLGALFWALARAMIDNTGATNSTDFFGVLAVVVTAVGLVGGLSMLAVGLLRED